MSDSYVPRFTTRNRAFSNVQPFTYEDGLTFFEVMERLIRWINDNLGNSINDRFDEVWDELARLEELIDGNEAQLVNHEDRIINLEILIQGIIDNAIEAQDPVVSGIVQDTTSETVASLVSAISNDAHPIHEAIRNMHTTTRMFVPAHAFGPVDGNRSPVELLNGTLGVGLNLAGGVNVWRMPPDANSAVGSVVEIPPGWHTFDIRFYWAHTIENPTGQINILAAVGRMEEGQDLTANDGANAIASVLMPPRRVIGLVDIPANTTLDGQGNMERIIIGRQGGSGADTFPNDAGFIGVELVKTT